MPDEIKPNPNQAPTQDAQLAAENMNSGEEKAPVIDVEADYEAAQQFSVSDVDRTGEGEKEAKEATSPQFEMSSPQKTTKTEAKETGDPADYMDMAQDVTP